MITDKKSNQQKAPDASLKRNHSQRSTQSPRKEDSINGDLTDGCWFFDILFRNFEQNGKNNDGPDRDLGPLNVYLQSGALPTELFDVSNRTSLTVES